MRKDLPSWGQVCSQLVHASNESISSPVPSGTRAVVLAAKNENHLLKIEQKLIELKIPHKSIREPDLGNSLTAIGLEPVEDRNYVRPVTKKLRLLEGMIS